MIRVPYYNYWGPKKGPYFRELPRWYVLEAAPRLKGMTWELRAASLKRSRMARNIAALIILNWGFAVYSTIAVRRISKIVLVIVLAPCI